MRVNEGYRGEQGTVAVMFALLVTGVLGVGALMIDVGALYIEGRQLQNGAESSALAIARTCAVSSCVAGAGNDLADANALDGSTLVETVCGTAPGLAGCASSGERQRFGCRPVSGTVPYVQVQTRSRRADGSDLVPGFMIRLLNPAHDGTSVRACARVAYGTPAGLTSELPLALSQCEWQWWTDRYLASFGTALVSEPYPSGSEAILYFHNTGDLGPSTCPQSSPSEANPQLPGGFGWLRTDGECAVVTDSAGDPFEKPGNSVPSDCDSDDFEAMHGQIVRVPLFGSITNSTGKYDIIGYAGFQLTGYRLGGPAYTRSSPTLGMPCTPASTRCIIGRFVVDPGPVSGELLPGPGYGVIGVRVVG